MKNNTTQVQRDLSAKEPKLPGRCDSILFAVTLKINKETKATNNQKQNIPAARMNSKYSLSTISFQDINLLLGF
tara:strand:- start:1219 stop:1440 length:222 start_codon:yes stop_codon:yes gene_type:complete